MANTLRIKRRAAGGAAGAPATLANAELAYNEQDNILYYGFGTGGAGGSATQVIGIAGPGFTVPNATKLAVPRSISASGDATWTVNFDGSANATAALTLANSGVTAGTYFSTTVDAKGRVTAGSNPTTLAGFGITDAQAKDADLTAIAALAGTAGLLRKTALDTWTLDTATYLTGNQTITASGDATGSGTTSIALTLAAVGTAGTYTKVTTDAKGRVTAGAALAATDIPTLTAAKVSDFDTQVRLSRLDQMAAPTANVSMNSKNLTNLLDPVNAQDAATKNYVDMNLQGLSPKAAVRAASTANIATLSGTMTIDGVALIAGDRVLVKDQTTASQNGIYVVAAGAWTRTTDANAWTELVSAFTFVAEGTVNADSGWLCSVNQGGTLETTAITFVQFSGAGSIVAGAGLTKTGNQIDVVGTAGRIVVNADNIDLATSGVTAGTYFSTTVDAYGRVTAGANPTTLAGFGITDAQAKDNTLTALAALTTAADQMVYSTGVDTFSMTALSAFARSLLDDADAATARTTLGLGTMATQAASAVAITGGTIDGIALDCGTF